MVDLRCTDQSFDRGDSMLGTAGHDTHYLLIELPLPWPKAIEDHPLLAGIDSPADNPAENADAADAGSTRILAILSDRPASVAPDGSPVHRVITYRGGDGSTFSHFHRYEGFIRSDDLADAVSDILIGDLDDLEPYDDGITDVLICTHGTRDRCCGTEGTSLFLALAADQSDVVRLWRTSHTGGHRFAPIALTFPDGYTWGRVTDQIVRGILDQSIEPSDLLEFNRGCMGFAEPAAQVADAVALSEAGWDWVTSEREVHVDSGHDSHGRPSAEGLSVGIGSEVAEFDIAVRLGPPIPVPVCGEPLEAAKKSTASFEVVEVTKNR